MKEMIWMFLYQMASPRQFYRWAGLLLPWLSFAAILFLTVGILAGLFWAPPDYQQGDAFRMMYFHVPSAFLSLMIYAGMTFCSLLSLVWRFKIADNVHEVLAPLGAWITALALVTGSLWGKPMWGTWWIWDARLTSELVLLFLYLGLIGLRQAIPIPQQAARAVAIFTLVGFIDVPLIHYSVNWWNTLHQGATLTLFAKPKIAAEMLYPLLAMIAGFICYSAAYTLYRTRTLVLLQNKDSRWVKQLVIG